MIISHCKGHDCIILLFDFEHFEDNHLRLLSTNVFCRNINFSRHKRVNIKVTDNIKKGKRFDCLRPKGEFVLSIDEIYGVPLIRVNFDDW